MMSRRDSRNNPNPQDTAEHAIEKPTDAPVVKTESMPTFEPQLRSELTQGGDAANNSDQAKRPDPVRRSEDSDTEDSDTADEVDDEE